MKRNDLVMHKHLPVLGIGIVVRLLKKTVEVKFSKNNYKKYNPSDLVVLDSSACQIVSKDDFKRGSDNIKKERYLIIGNAVERRTDVGWEFLRIVTRDDLKHLKRVL